MRQPVEHGSKIQAIQSVQIPKKLIFTAEREEGKATSGTNIISSHILDHDHLILRTLYLPPNHVKMSL